MTGDETWPRNPPMLRREVSPHIICPLLSLSTKSLGLRSRLNRMLEGSRVQSGVNVPQKAWNELVGELAPCGLFIVFLEMRGIYD